MLMFILQTWWQEWLWSIFLTNIALENVMENNEMVAKTFAEAAALVERARWTRFCSQGLQWDGDSESQPEVEIIQNRLTMVADMMKTAPMPHVELNVNDAIRSEQARWGAILRDVRVFSGKFDEPAVENAINILYEIASTLENSI